MQSRVKPYEGTSVAILTGGLDPHYATDLAMALLAQGMKLDVVGGDEFEGTALQSAPGVNLLNLRRRPSRLTASRKIWSLLVYYVDLMRYAATAQPKILHVLWNSKIEFFDRTLLMLYYKALGKKVFFTAHNVNAGKRDGNDSWLNRLTLKVQYHLADHIFVHTDKMKSDLIGEFAVEAGKISVIPFGINNSVPNTDMTPAMAKRRLGIGPEEKTILFFGTIRPYKGIEHLVEAFQQLVVDDPSYRLVIAGEPKREDERYQHSLQQMIESDASRGRILSHMQFVPDDETEAYFKAADVFVLPYKEIFQSGVLFLGYSFGLPVVATDVGSFKDEIVEGQTGFLCRAGDVSDLSRALRGYFASELYRNLNRHRPLIRDHAHARHSWESVAEITGKAYIGISKNT